MQITVSSIREAAPDRKIDLILKYINNVDENARLTLEQELTTVNMVISCKQAGLALDRWSDLTYISPDEGYNAYEYLRDYYGIDTNVPLSVAELYEKYPGLFHDRCVASEEELYSWYNALTIRIMVKISEQIKHDEGVKTIEQEVAREAMKKSAMEVARIEKTKSKKRTETDSKDGKRHPTTRRTSVPAPDPQSKKLICHF